VEPARLALEIIQLYTLPLRILTSLIILTFRSNKYASFMSSDTLQVQCHMPPVSVACFETFLFAHQALSLYHRQVTRHSLFILLQNIQCACVVFQGTGSYRK
jgi:hypothetical protein